MVKESSGNESGAKFRTAVHLVAHCYFIRAPTCSGSPGMEFVKNFTPPDFQAKNFTPSISPNFKSFGKKKHKK